MNNKKTFLERLQEARIELQLENIKKSGKNKYAGFSYYELADFLPAVNLVCQKRQLVTHFGITASNETEIAKLEVLDALEPQNKIVFSVPTAEVEIGKSRKSNGGGAQPIQNLGAKITYLRRYLFLIAFEICESDAVDSLPQKVQENKNYRTLDHKTIEKITGCETIDELKEVCKNLAQTHDREAIKVQYQKRLALLRKEEIH